MALSRRAVRRDRIAAAVLRGRLPRASPSARARFGVSEVTVRADLAALEAEGRVRRVHGGATPVVQARPASRRSKTRPAAMPPRSARSAVAPSACCPPARACFLDVGSTALAVAHAARRSRRPARTRRRDQRSLDRARARAGDPAPRRSSSPAAPCARCSTRWSNPLAGQSSPASTSTSPSSAATASTQAGRVTNLNLAEAEIKRELLLEATTRILVADGSKAGARHLGLIGQLSEFDVLVTDAAGGRALTGASKEAGIRLETVPS